MFTRETQRLDYVQRRSFNWMKHYIYVAGRCSRWLIRNRSYFPVKCSAIQMKYVVTEYFTDIFLPLNYVFCLCVPCVCNQVMHIKWRYTCGALTECVSIGFLLFTLAVPFVVVASAKHLISYLCLKTTTRRLTRFFSTTQLLSLYEFTDTLVFGFSSPVLIYDVEKASRQAAQSQLTLCERLPGSECSSTTGMIRIRQAWAVRGQLCSRVLHPVTSQSRKSPFLPPNLKLPPSSHQPPALSHLLDTHCEMSCSPSLSPPLLVKSIFLTCVLLSHCLPSSPTFLWQFFPRCALALGWLTLLSLFLTHCFSPSTTTTSPSSLFCTCPHTHRGAGRPVFSYRTPFIFSPLSSMCKWVLWTRLHQNRCFFRGRCGHPGTKPVCVCAIAC